MEIMNVLRRCAFNGGEESLRILAACCCCHPFIFNVEDLTSEFSFCTINRDNSVIRNGSMALLLKAHWAHLSFKELIQKKNLLEISLKNKMIFTKH